MGKTTRFHPISLPTIRGSARDCGWVFGRIRQVGITADNKTAFYHVPILETPGGIVDYSLTNMKAALQGCYSADIAVGTMWITFSGVLMVELCTTIDERLYGLHPTEWGEAHDG